MRGNLTKVPALFKLINIHIMKQGTQVFIKTSVNGQTSGILITTDTRQIKETAANMMTAQLIGR